MKTSLRKRLTKLSGLFLGLAMGLGVATGVTAGNNKASEVRAEDVTLSANFSGSASSNGGFTASGGATNKSYYQLKKGNVVSNSAYSDVDVSKSVSVSFYGGTYGGTDASKNSVIFYATDSSGTAISTKLTLTPTTNKETGGPYSGTISFNTGASGKDVKFRFDAASAATTSIYCRFLKFTITYTKAAAGPVINNITLNQAGGTGGTASVSATNGSAMPAITLPTKTGYTFGGYYTGENGTGTQYYAANGSSTKNWDGTSDTTLYAKWTINSYTVSGTITNGSLSSTANINHGTSFTRTINPSTGYTYPASLTSLSINGVTQTAGSGYTYNSSNGQISIDASKVVGNIVINATCPKKQYSITDSVENGSLNVSSIEHGSDLTITITPDSDYKLPDSVTIKRSGSNFTSFTYENGVITIAGANVTGNFEVIGTCYQEFSLTVICNNGTYDTTANTIKSGETVAIEFTANEGYFIPLTENEIDVVNAEIIEYASGILEIGNATGDVTVTCTCNQVTNKSVSVSMSNVENITGTGTEAIELGGEATVELDAVSGYRLPTTNAFSITGADSNIVLSNNNTHAIISLSNCSGDVVISGTPVRIFNITTNITNGTCSPSSATVDKGSEWNATISANNGYKLPTSISVTIGGNVATLGSDYTYNTSTGAVSVKSVTGAVVISASMDELASASISVVGSGSYSDKFTSSGDTTLVEGSTAEITISPKSDSSGVYFIKDSDINVEGALKISYVSNVLKIGSLEGNTVTITVTPEKREVNSIQITSNPSKTSYILGDTLNTSGLKVLGTYNDGSGTVDVTTDCEVTVDGEAMFTTGSHSATVSYGNCESKTFGFTVQAKDYTTQGEPIHTYSYDKVTAAQTDYSGTYIIVYEASSTSAYIFNGKDEASDYVTGTISNGQISATLPEGACRVEIAAMTGGYSVKVLDGTNIGKYLAGNSSKNQLNFNQSANCNTIAFSNGMTLTSGRVLQFNTGTSDMRFRYYSSGGQKAIAFYKYTDHVTPGESVPSDEKHAIRIKDAACTKTELIAGETLSVNDFNISVQYDTANTIYSNLKPTSISKTTILEGENTYTLSFKDSYNNTVTKDIVLTGKEAPKLDHIYVTYDETWSNEFTRLDKFNSDGVHVWASYSNDYEDKEVTSSASIVPTSMSVAGEEIKVNVSYTEGGDTKETSYYIGINPIHTTSLTYVIKDSSGEVVGLTDGYYNIVPGENYSVTYTVNGDYNSVTVNSGATANTTLVDGVLSSKATANEITTFVVSCDQATNVQIPVKVIAACDATLSGFETSSTGATASITDGKHGTFSGYIGDTVAIELTTMNYSNPKVAEKEQVEGLSISGSVTNDVYNGTITISKSMTNQSYTLVVSETEGGEQKEIVLTFTAVVDQVAKLTVTPTKTGNYIVGDEFDSRMTVIATYQSGKVNNNFTDYTISGNPEGPMKRGTYTITVTANGTNVHDSFDINVVKPSGLVIVTSGMQTVEDPDNPITTPKSGTVTPTWGGLGKNDRVAKNSTLTATNIGHYLTSVTVSFEGKALSSNKGSLFNFMLQVKSGDTIVDKYTVYYTTTNEDGTGYYVTTDSYEELSLTITGISESDCIDGFVFTACDKLTPSGSANGNLDKQNESATYTYNVSVPGEKEVPVYNENSISDELYDFFIMANEKYFSICDGGVSSPNLTNWDLSNSAEYLALSNNDRNLLATGLCGDGTIFVDGTYQAGSTNSSDMVVEFLQKYDYVVYKYGNAYNYISNSSDTKRTPTAVPGLVQASTASAMFKNMLSNLGLDVMFNEENAPTSWVLLVTIAVAGLATGGYFYIRKRKED